MIRPWMMALLLAPAALRAQAEGACAPARDEASAAVWLARTDSAFHLPAGLVFRWESATHVVNDYQSDRTYPPYLSAYYAERGWYAPASGAVRFEAQMTWPGQGPGPWPTVLAGPAATWMVRDTQTLPMPPLHRTGQRQRTLLPWTVVADWRRAGDARVEGRCVYRDYPRVVLVRGTGPAVERLYLDPKTALPVALRREEPHYLWGQQDVAYVWTNWDRGAAGELLPTTIARMVDGEMETGRTVGTYGWVAPDSAPALALPDPALVMTVPVDAFLQPTPPDTIRIGPTVALLRNRGYTEGVVLARDTVWVLDATQGEARARADSAAIAALFPGRHPVAVIVTDLAWPHVAGVRFWVARGATIVSHRASAAFLQRVVARGWTREPDLLERERRAGRAPRLRFRAVNDSLALAGGALTLHAIDGIASEGALVAWVPGERFLWASDYIQTVRQPTEYAAEVRAAAQRAGLRPERVAAEHLPLTPWATVEALFAAP